MTDPTPTTEAGLDAAWKALVDAIYSDALRGPNSIPGVVNRHRAAIEAQARAEALDVLRVALDESRRQWEHAKAGEAYRTLERAVRAILTETDR